MIEHAITVSISLQPCAQELTHSQLVCIITHPELSHWAFQSTGFIRSEPLHCCGEAPLESVMVHTCAEAMRRQHRVHACTRTPHEQRIRHAPHLQRIGLLPGMRSIWHTRMCRASGTRSTERCLRAAHPAHLANAAHPAHAAFLGAGGRLKKLRRGVYS